MTERLLQFIWQFRYFNHHDLRLETGEDLAVLSPGKINTHQGPDFLWATVRIGNAIWAGHIELHLRASGWRRHGHGEDKHYNNVILHVVWENDVEGRACAASPDDETHRGPRNIPVLVLHDRVPKLLLGKYRDWMTNQSFVPCERQLSLAHEAIWPEWKQTLVEERLQRRALVIRGFLQENKQHWDETIWWLLARNFGIPVNGGAFEAVARSISVNILARLRSRPEEVEALLLGQAGLLEADGAGDGHGHGLTDGELPMFRKIFQHLKIKYRLEPIHEPILFLRMRPAGFPVRRLRQLAALTHVRSSWFSAIREAASLKDLRVLVSVMSEEMGLPIGLQMKNSILINTMLPFLYAYGRLRGESHSSACALSWYTGIEPEKNAVISGWGELGILARHAADSQALLELKGQYCDHRRCLECGIGKALLLRA
jgi:hypothetical protein